MNKHARELMHDAGAGSRPYRDDPQSKVANENVEMLVAGYYRLFQGDYVANMEDEVPEMCYASCRPIDECCPSCAVLRENMRMCLEYLSWHSRNAEIRRIRGRMTCNWP